MIIGIGTDIVEVSRIKKSVEQFDERFLNKIFTEVELEYSLQKKNKFQHLAGRFAAKEAIVKALSSCCDKGFVWKEIEIFNDIAGRPHVRLFGKFKEFIAADKELLISISHTDKFATAVAILQQIEFN